jgi:hypothetical protein
MLTDGSKDYKDTWEFLDRRLDDFVTFSNTQATVEKSIGFAGTFVESMLTSVFGQSNSNNHHHHHHHQQHSSGHQHQHSNNNSNNNNMHQQSNINNQVENNHDIHQQTNINNDVSSSKKTTDITKE